MLQNLARTVVSHDTRAYLVERLALIYCQGCWGPLVCDNDVRG